MNQEVLVIGGAGYIGSVLVPLLLAKGHNVAVLDSFKAGHGLGQCCRYREFTPIKCDVRDKVELADIVSRYDVVFALAAIVGGPACATNPKDAKAVNTSGIYQLVESLEKHQKLIFPNTDAGYDPYDKEREACNEDVSITCNTVYTESKMAAEQEVLYFGGVSIRLGSAFGVSPKMRDDALLNWLVKEAVTKNHVEYYEPESLRGFIHVRSVAQSFCMVMEQYEKMQGEAFNYSLPGITKQALVQMIVEQTGASADIVDGEDPESRDYSLDCSKIFKAAGINPRYSVSLREGIEELVKYYRMGKGNDLL